MIVTSFFSLFISQTVFAKNMYRWIDDKGRIHYSETVLPKDINYRRESLNKAASVKEVVEEAKTKEEQEMEKRLVRLRRDQEKIITRQKVYDNALLNTYHSKADLMMAIKSKMDAFETQNQVVEGNLIRLKQELEAQQKNAAEMDRNAQKVPKKLLDGIKSTQKQIQELHIAINEQKEKQSQIKREDEADIARFLFLTQSLTEKRKGTSIPSIKEANELGLFYCENDRQCNKAWEIARTFVEYYSTTPPDVYNDKLIMNRPPATDTDISLSLSKIPLTDDESQLFLDVHCRESSLGKDLCVSQKVKDIRATFIPYVNDALSRTAQ
ncbi:MAG: DUF4124 domain-containing protein [Methylococcaceae bacterium]|nr:DUF4124 domain-containing protein [Methylococcaceae bacterium]